MPYDPEEWDYKIGEWVELEKVHDNDTYESL